MTGSAFRGIPLGATVLLAEVVLLGVRPFVTPACSIMVLHTQKKQDCVATGILKHTQTKKQTDPFPYGLPVSLPLWG
jgi:hypothetical protein